MLIVKNRQQMITLVAAGLRRANRKTALLAIIVAINENTKASEMAQLPPGEWKADSETGPNISDRFQMTFTIELHKLDKPTLLKMAKVLGDSSLLEDQSGDRIRPSPKHFNGTDPDWEALQNDNQFFFCNTTHGLVK